MSSNATAALTEAITAAGGPTPVLAELCAAVAVSNDGNAEAEWREVFPDEGRSLAVAAGMADLDRRVQGRRALAPTGPALCVRRRPAREPDVAEPPERRPGGRAPLRGRCARPV